MSRVDTTSPLRTRFAHASANDSPLSTFASPPSSRYSVTASPPIYSTNCGSGLLHWAGPRTAWW